MATINYHPAFQEMNGRDKCHLLKKDLNKTALMQKLPWMKSLPKEMMR